MTWSNLSRSRLCSTSKCYKIELYLQWQTDKKSYAIYQMVPFSITLNDPNLDAKGMPLFDVDYLKNIWDKNILTMEY